MDGGSVVGAIGPAVVGSGVGAGGVGGAAVVCGGGDVVGAS